MLLFLLSLTGIPPTAGFVAKFVVITSAVGAGQIPLAVLAVACSVVTAFIYMRVAVLMYMKEPQEPAPPRYPVAVSVALAVSALVILFGGIFPGYISLWAVSPSTSINACPSLCMVVRKRACTSFFTNSMKPSRSPR